MDDRNIQPQEPKTYGPSDLVEGSLFEGGGRTKIRYLPVVVSRLSCSVLCEVDLHLGDHFVLDCGGRRIGLVLTKIDPYPRCQDLKQYKLESLNHKSNIEELIGELPELGGLFDLLQIRSGRLNTHQDFFVTAKTFGSREPYRLKVENVSKSGLKVSTVPGEMTPFSVNTVLEIIIDPQAKLMDQSLPCLGKIMRMSDESGKIEFGLRFIERSDQFIYRWGLWLDRLEEKISGNQKKESSQVA